jgi:hypothetical protein
MSDLVALQVVDRVADDQYKLAPHIKSTAAGDLAHHINAQLARHVMCRELTGHDRETPVSVDDLEAIVRKMKPNTRLSETVVHQYAMNLKRWLLFAGHLEERESLLYRPVSRGAQMGQLRVRRSRVLGFLGSSTPRSLIALLRRLAQDPQGVAQEALQRDGFRNALYDAFALEVVVRGHDKRVLLAIGSDSLNALQERIREAVRRQPSVRIIAAALDTLPQITNAELGTKLQAEMKQSWKHSSAQRYANGLRRFYTWAAAEKGASQVKRRSRRSL